MFKYNLAVFIKFLSLLVLLTPLLFSQENNNDSTLKTSQIYERIMFIEVRGSQRIESDTIKSYMTVKPGDLYDDAEVDRSLKILFNTGLFADVAIRYEKSGLIVFVIENPIINRIDFEGNKALKDDKFEDEEIKEIGLEYKSLGFIKESFHLSQIYSAADIFVASSIQDAWPKTFAEAMYCGTPVVCFNKTSISEIVDHKVNGYVVDDFDALSLKDGIDWLSDQVIKKTLRPEKIQGKILNYSPEKIGLKYVELYKKILSIDS